MLSLCIKMNKTENNIRIYIPSMIMVFVRLKYFKKDKKTEIIFIYIIYSISDKYYLYVFFPKVIPLNLFCFI